MRPPEPSAPALQLYRLRAEDRASFLEAVRASRALHHPWVSPADTPEAFDRYLERARGEAFEAMLLRRDPEGELLGVFNLSQIFHGPFQSAYLSYYAFAPHARKGHMRRGLDLLLRHAFEELGLHRLEANLQPANAASRALVRGAGFHMEGFSPRYLKIDGAWRDHERWALLREEHSGEWQRPPRAST